MKQYLVTKPRYDYYIRQTALIDVNPTDNETIYGEACEVDESGALHFFTNYDDTCSFYAIASGHWISIVESDESE